MISVTLRKMVKAGEISQAEAERRQALVDEMRANLDADLALQEMTYVPEGQAF